MPDKATLATYITSLIAFFSALTVNQWIAIASISVSLFAAYTNWWHKNKDIQIKLTKLELEIKSLRITP